tara:strand:+ start:2483 stop:3178 length:696 start_codon:yes stop_codon:yes gene_type:complete
MKLLKAVELLEGLLYESDLDRLRALRRIKRASRAPTDRLLDLLRQRAEQKKDSSKPKFIGQVGYLKLAWSFDGKKDRYIHYTTRENARKILKSNVLDNQGTRENNFVISMVFGKNYPSVQRGTVCGLRGAKECDIVAIVFKSDVQPLIGYQDEVVFRGRTKIKNAQMYDLSNGKFKAMLASLKGMPGITQDHVDSEVYYTPKSISDAEKEAKGYSRDQDDDDDDWRGFDRQ